MHGGNDKTGLSTDWYGAHTNPLQKLSDMARVGMNIKWAGAPESHTAFVMNLKRVKKLKARIGRDEGGGGGEL